MRLLLTKHSKNELCKYLKKQNQSNSLKELSIRINIPKSTLENWFYDTTRYIPEKIIPKHLIKKLEIIDKQQDNWGKTKGGKKTYYVLLKKYGAGEIKKRQIAGGKAKNNKTKDAFKININSPLFLEFYGALLGDGWLSALSYTYNT
ncbi:hypothetical protein KY333_04880, partial [Candidatus Woesearchaeota archaeon]|nr:hypothetical protein [Candidatus Woesearchaeota archaeon]MBW2994545.1 hypothetical protein [Candidatus Woesearchaeota archaeon]